MFLSCILYNKLINVSEVLFLFCEPFKQILEPEEGVIGTPNLQTAGMKQRGYGGLVSESGTSLVRLSPQPAGSATTPGSQVRTELNCRARSWCQNWLLSKKTTKKNPHTFGVRSAVGVKNGTGPPSLGLSSLTCKNEGVGPKAAKTPLV